MFNGYPEEVMGTVGMNSIEEDSYAIDDQIDGKKGYSRKGKPNSKRRLNPEVARYAASRACKLNGSNALKKEIDAAYKKARGLQKRVERQKRSAEEKQKNLDGRRELRRKKKSIRNNKKSKFGK